MDASENSGLSRQDCPDRIVPVVHCFDDNYSVPAAVAFYSMLENADKNYCYKIYVLTSDVSDDNKNFLFQTIEPFENAQLEFIDMNNKFEDLFKKTSSKNHYSKEIYYKLITPSIFPQYDKIVVADVDVVYLGDVSEAYNGMDVNEPYYIYAPTGLWKADDNEKQARLKCLQLRYKNFNEEEKEKVRFGAGFMVYNHKKMREDNIENKLLSYINENFEKVFLPEQDTLNMVCEHIKDMPYNYMVCNGDFERFETYDVESCRKLKVLTRNPLQLHYSTQEKPWNSSCSMNEIWFQYLLKTPMFKTYTDKLFKKVKKKTLLSFVTPLIKRKFILTKQHV